MKTLFDRFAEQVGELDKKLAQLESALVAAEETEIASRRTVALLHARNLSLQQELSSQRRINTIQHSHVTELQWLLKYYYGDEYFADCKCCDGITKGE